jgi:hypothetical protein
VTPAYFGGFGFFGFGGLFGVLSPMWHLLVRDRPDGARGPPGGASFRVSVAEYVARPVPVGGARPAGIDRAVPSAWPAAPGTLGR